MRFFKIESARNAIFQMSLVILSLEKQSSGRTMPVNTLGGALHRTALVPLSTMKSIEHLEPEQGQYIVAWVN